MNNQFIIGANYDCSVTILDDLAQIKVPFQFNCCCNQCCCGWPIEPLTKELDLSKNDIIILARRLGINPDELVED